MSARGGLRSGGGGVREGIVEESGPESPRRRRLNIECLRDCDCDKSWGLGAVDARLSLEIGRGGDCEGDGRVLSGTVSAVEGEVEDCHCAYNLASTGTAWFAAVLSGFAMRRPPSDWDRLRSSILRRAVAGGRQAA